MKYSCLFRFLPLWFALMLAATGTAGGADAVQDEFKEPYRENAQHSAPADLGGTISEITTAGGITYIKVDAGNEAIWAAGPADNTLRKGDAISFSAAMRMENFHSKSLDRDFDVIYFVRQFVTGGRTPAEVAPSGQTGKPQAPDSPAQVTAGTPGEVLTGSLLREAPLDGLNTEDKPLSAYRGKPLIINVWASWCGPCRAEMGSLERLAKRYNGARFNMIGISTDDYRDKADAFVDQANVSFENYIDHALLMENMLGASTIPLTVLVDADGRVLQKVRGAREWDSPDVVRAIESVFQIQLM